MARGEYGPTNPRGTYRSGQTAIVKAKITAYHAGWFEFRLAVPADGGTDKSVPVTQDLLNSNVLKIAPSTPGYPLVLNYRNMKGMSKNGNGGWYKCKKSGGHNDDTSKTPQERWPHGTCCNEGGVCSDPADNKDRYIVEYAPGGGGNKDYEIHLLLPNVTCERCVLQWTYQTVSPWF